MKEEKEVYWLNKILNTDYKRKLLGNSKGGCKTDFERACNISFKNKEFRLLLSSLIKEGCLEFFREEETMGGLTNTYTVNEKNIMKRIKKSEFGKTFYDACVNDYT